MKRKERATRKTAWFGFSIIGAGLIGILYFTINPVYQSIKEESLKTKFYEDFPGMDTAASLPNDKRKQVINKANQERCSCDCGYTLASCLKVDLNCPLRESNLTKVKEMLRDAKVGSSLAHD